MDIAFIAPYDRMRIIAQSIVDHQKLPAQVMIGNMEAGVRAARQALREGAKIIISRGLTARLIRETFTIEVLEVKVSANSVLAYVYERSTTKTRIALAGFKDMIELAEPICAALKRQYACFELGGERSYHAVMNDVEAFGPSVIIGDALATTLAEGRSLKHHLVESTETTISEALAQAMQMLQTLNRHMGRDLKKEAGAKNAKGFVARYTFDDIVRQSRVMNELIEVARAYSATDSGVMIRGETGTGKELFAQSIHNASPLKHGPFVAVNCAALPGTLLESELFGYAPGAFTGALKGGKPGLFELAHGGTLFLDEITEMDIFLQSRLLRAIQAREIMRLGDERVIPVKVRVVAATNIDPAEAIAGGRLRADLFFRLNVLDIHIPPLRERPGDAAHIFRHFLSRCPEGVKKPGAEYLRALNQAPWPGNVRELENFAEKYRTISRLPGKALPAPPGPARGPQPRLGDSLHETIRGHAETVLREEQGNISRAARRLGVSRNTLKRRLGMLHS